MIRRTWWRCERLDEPGTFEDKFRHTNERVECAEHEANLVGSRLDSWHLSPELHAPVLDIDLPCRLEPSTTPGHFHLYIDKAMKWPDYERLLTVLAEVGIIEPGYADASIRRRQTFVRKPGVVKPQSAPSSGGPDSRAGAAGISPGHARIDY
jgi:hypothetical protein